MRCRMSVWALIAIPFAAVAAVSPAHAQGVPSPGNATVPASIRLVGLDAFGVPDPAGLFTVVLRDLANNPVPNAIIRVELLPCSGASLCPLQGPTITAVNCNAGGLWVEGLTDVNGVWSAAIVGCAKGNPVVSPFGCARIYGKGVLLNSPRVAIADLGGCDGLGSNDLGLWLGDFYTGLDFQRSDYDGNGLPGANDLSLWLTEWGSARSVVNCGGTACP